MTVTTDPSFLIILAAVGGTFLTVMAFILPYIKSDPLATRMKNAAKRRQDLRTQQLELIQQKSKLRRIRPSLFQDLVERLKLRELFAGEELRAKLVQANWRESNAVAKFAAARAGAPILFALLSSMWAYSTPPPVSPGLQPGVVFLALVIGVYLPNILVQNAIAKRQQALTLGFPDALDLLLICVESGLSLEVGFGRVAKEIGDNYPELAEEFELTTAELAYLPDRRIALENLTLRTGLPQVKAVCTTLIQAEKYGTPLTSALRTASQENREERLAKAEKKAASLPATLTVPMILFFLPVLFVVVIGPAAIQVSRMN
ncbi:MAG: type II secretion system F family protein [Rhodospirillaceae bacterium]